MIVESKEYCVIKGSYEKLMNAEDVLCKVESGMRNPERIQQ